MTEPSPIDRRRMCAWCRGPIRSAARRDAITCSTRCRQARNRFVQGVGTPPPVEGGRPLRLAYADPPYPGLSRKCYSEHPDYAGEVDHSALIASLAADYDGWALSTSAASLRDILASCPPGVRIAAWHRGERPARSRGPLSAWEPVIFAGGRLAVVERDASRVDARLDPNATAQVSRGFSRRVGDRYATDCVLDGATLSGSERDASGVLPRRIDSLIYRPGNRTTDPGRVVGTKPAAFIRWIFDLLGALPGDDFVDIFPGSGGVSRAWRLYCGEEA